jgi:hypothetical protein
MRRGKNMTKREHLSAALRAQPDEVRTLRTLQVMARATGDYEKALSHLVSSTQSCAPNLPARSMYFGVTTLHMDLLLDALPVFEQFAPRLS